MYAKVSTPTHIGQSNPPYQLATCPFGSFLNKPHTEKPSGSCNRHYTILPPFRSPHSPVNAQRYSSQIQCSTFYAVALDLAFIRTPCVAIYAERYAAYHEPANSIQPPLPRRHTTAPSAHTHHEIPPHAQNGTLIHLHNPRPSSSISCPPCHMQRHPPQQISASQVLLTNSQHTTSSPS